MSAHDSRWVGLLAIDGSPLIGDAWVKQIHFDEAGRDVRDRVAVVAGVIIDADQQFRVIEAAITAAVEEHIPTELRPGFVFHAKDVFGKWKRRFGWDIPKCNEIVDAWLGILDDFDLPVSLGWFTKLWMRNGKADVFQNNMAHNLAFGMALQVSDDLIADHFSGEVASAIVEDCPEMRKYLRDMQKALKNGSLKEIAPAMFKGQLSHVMNGLQFCEKDEAVFLQLADAAAFSFKRFVNGNPGGDQRFKKLVRLPDLDIARVRVSPAGTRVIWKRSGARAG